MKEIYLDNAATTPLDPQVLKAMEPFWLKTYGNPSSFNDAGRKAREAVENSRKKIARILGAKNQEIIFTSSATEANNLAILGLAEAIKSIKPRPKPHIITTKIEHPSVLEPIKKLEKEGFDVTYLSVNQEGLINLSEFKKALRPETILVSIIYVNNEVGSIQPIKKIAKIIKNRNESLKPKTYLAKTYFHTDAAQAISQDINVNNLGVDLMTISSHKLYGPKGIAALYVRRGTPLTPLLYGGGQEFGLRSSTEAAPLIVGFAKALELTNDKRLMTYDKISGLREYFINGLKKVLPAVKINGPEKSKDRAPHIISVTFPGVESEQLLLHLDKCGVRASAGSACTSREIEPSYVLTAIGLSKTDARSTIRFSLGRQTSKKDLGYVLRVLPKIINKIEKLYPSELKKYYYLKPAE